MNDQTSAPAGGEAIAASTPADTSELSISQARDMLFAQIAESDKEQPAESAEPEATAEPESAQADADPQDAAPSEDAPEAEPAETEPPIEPPRSWTKDRKEQFKALPRDLQQYVADRVQEQDREFRTRQNEVAEKLKGLTAREQEADKARQQYETKIASALEVLEKEQLRDFPDIKTFADVEKMALEDPFRKIQWDTHQQKMQVAAWEKQQADARKAQEQQSKRNAYETEQNARLIELVPEMADPKKASELRTRAVAMLTDDLGLKTDQLSRWMADDTGHEILSNAGIQKLIADGLKYRDIQAAPKAIAAKPVPPVQRPGVSRPSASVDSTIQALEEKLAKTGSIKDAEALLNAQIRASQRRAS